MRSSVRLGEGFGKDHDSQATSGDSQRTFPKSIVSLERPLPSPVQAATIPAPGRGTMKHAGHEAKRDQNKAAIESRPHQGVIILSAKHLIMFEFPRTRRPVSVCVCVCAGIACRLYRLGACAVSLESCPGGTTPGTRLLIQGVARDGVRHLIIIMRCN